MLARVTGERAQADRLLAAELTGSSARIERRLGSPRPLLLLRMVILRSNLTLWLLRTRSAAGPVCRVGATMRPG
jgi:hypothetical protein